MAPRPQAQPESAKHLEISILALFFVSGFAALSYQVLWWRDLGLLFGATAYAAATTIAVFIFGITLGGWLWGRLADRCKRPLMPPDTLDRRSPLAQDTQPADFFSQFSEEGP